MSDLDLAVARANQDAGYGPRYDRFAGQSGTIAFMHLPVDHPQFAVRLDDIRVETFPQPGGEVLTVITGTMNPSHTDEV